MSAGRMSGARRSRRFVACGLMSGTSRDGIDVALIEIAGRFPRNQVRLLHAETVPYPGWLKAALLESVVGGGAERVTALDFAVGRSFADAARRAMKRAGLGPADIAVIGSHGQTVLHLPGGARLGSGPGAKRLPGTLQVGRGSVIAQVTGVATVADFRSADIAVGGEGAPLVPVYDYVTLRSKTRSRVALNIGGIANLTAIPKGAPITSIISFDTGPGNCVLDVAARRLTRGKRAYDKDGAMARAGRLDRKWLGRIMAHPYFARRPPKSTGWEEFGEEFTGGLVRRMAERGAGRPGTGRSRTARSGSLGPADVMRTLTEAVAQSVASAIADFVAPRMRPDEVIVTGGGARNAFLMERLRELLAWRFPGIAVERGEAFGVDSDAKEASAFAYLAYLHLARVPANVASQAAGLKPAILGCLYPAG
jgi:anhydro-N-acetylmuramic acid kinase